MKNIFDYISLVSGRLGLLFIAGGLFIIAADYFNAQPHDDDDGAAVRTVQCARSGACEAS